MILLALDTASSATCAALVDDDRPLGWICLPMERGHQERLAGVVDRLMQEAGLKFAALERIGVTVGPGSFTGLRVGLAFAKGLALALRLDCAGVSVLEALAASGPPSDRVAAAIDAHRGQVYLQGFHGARPAFPPEALSLAEAAERLERTGPWDRVTGSAAGLVGGVGSASIDERSFADPLQVARLAAAVTTPVARPEPLYLRRPDARTLAERAAARA